MRAYNKLTHKFLKMLFLVTIWCCLPACAFITWSINSGNFLHYGFTLDSRVFVFVF